MRSSLLFCGLVGSYGAGGFGIYSLNLVGSYRGVLGLQMQEVSVSRAEFTAAFAGEKGALIKLR